MQLRRFVRSTGQTEPMRVLNPVGTLDSGNIPDIGGKRNPGGMPEPPRQVEGNQLASILERRAIRAVYQPVLSLSQKRVIGYEGLVRAHHPTDGDVISPLRLFRWAEGLDGCESGTWRLLLDRMCRDACLRGFRPILQAQPQAQLFLNLDTSVLELACGSDYLRKQADRAGIPHGNIILEICEGGVRDERSLLAFVDRYRAYGFLIALDDVGTGFSNLDRISLLKPDLVKLDRSLLQGMETSFHKQEVFRCLVNLANKVGAVVVAEGVETRDELQTALRLGAHFVQGFLFARPVPASGVFFLPLQTAMEKEAGRYVEQTRTRMEEERQNRLGREALMEAWMKALEGEPAGSRSRLLAQWADRCDIASFECAYLLDDRGVQTTDTCFGKRRMTLRPRSGHVFTPTQAGADNSMKRYFHELIHAGMGRYVSEPYVSHATGSICITHSRLSSRSGEAPFVLCVDFKVPVAEGTVKSDSDIEPVDGRRDG